MIVRGGKMEMSMDDYCLVDVIEEAQFCCEHERYFAALATALTLPDICAGIEMKKKGIKEKKGMCPYAIWCNKWMKQFLPSISPWSEPNRDWGYVLYKLRCGILHNGDVDVCGKPYGAFDVNAFHLYVGEDDFTDRSMVISQHMKTGGFGYGNTAKIDMDIRYLICAITSASYDFIKSYDLQKEELSVLGSAASSEH